ncbi:MAG: hypothetical protein Q9160_005143 [Pyrenula sp. 1 TL-2023]
MSTDSASSSRSSSPDSIHDRRRKSASRYEDFRRASQRLDEQADRQTWSEFLRDADDETTFRNESTITIPRQFIVHPPENQRASIFQNEPIDLTQDDTENSAEENNMPSPQRGNPALGGGEEVRLCRPCVPDPQPAPPGSSRFTPGSSSNLPNLGRLQNYSNHVTPDAMRNSIRGSPQFQTVAEQFEGRPWERDWQNDRDVFVSADGRRRSTSLMHDSFGSPSAQLRQEEGQRQRDFRRQRGRGMIFQPEDRHLNAIRTGAEEIPEEGLPRYGAFDYTVVPRYTRPRLPPGYSPSNNPLPAPPEYSSQPGSTSANPNAFRNSLPNIGGMPPHMGRFSPFAPVRPPPHDPSRSLPGGRPRVRSMMDPSTSSASSSAPRMRISESDLCPICFRIFPPIGPNTSEASREQHIAECISSRETASSPSSHSRSMSSSSRPHAAEGIAGHRLSISSQQHPGSPAQPIIPEVAPQMLPFKATEKDCVGQDGNPQECSICMVEYDVGDPLARLECLCCFHEECIRSWFDRKKECPVHKVA